MTTSKTPQPAPQAPETDGTVTGYLERDHDRLDALLDEAQRLLASGDRDLAATRFAEFRAGLQRHIRMEEEILFPAFELASGLRAAGPTERMRHEHRQIEGILAALSAAFEAGGPALTRAFESLRADLLGVLVDHNVKEERVLYPMSDQLMPAAERDDLVRRMKAV